MQGSPTQPPPGQNEFTAMPQDQLGQEHLPATPLVFGAYAVVWVVLVVYVITLWRRLRRVEREVHEVAARAGGRQP